MSLNLVVVDGVASHVALRYDESSKPELRWTLTQTDKEWPLYKARHNILYISAEFTRLTLSAPA